MIYRVRLLEPEAAFALARTVSALDGWRDGRETAGVNIRARKRNEQLLAAPEPLRARVAELMGSESVVARIGPAIICAPRFSRYRKGDHYDWHVDGALDGVLPADVSMSLVLQDAVGGRIHVRVGDVSVALDPKAGEAVFWASHLEHCVEPVEEGCRVVAIAGLQTMVRDPVAREICARLARLSPFVSEEGRSDLGFVTANALRYCRS